MVRTCFVAVALVACTSTTYGAPPEETLPFEPGTAPLVVVQVRVNGTGPYPFLVDTGSSHSSIDAGLATALGARRVAKTLVSTAIGSEWAAVVRLDRVDVGPVIAAGVLATEVPGSRLAALAHAQGVIGLDILRARSFTLDYATRHLSWRDDRDDARSAVLPLSLAGGVWFVTAQGPAGALQLMLDSGADLTTLVTRGLKGASGTGEATARSVVGVQTVRHGTVPELRFGPLKLLDVEVATVDGDAVERAAHGDGLLPLHLFDRVTFRPQQGVVILTPAGNRDDHSARVQ